MQNKEQQDVLKQRLDFDYALLNAIDSPIFWQDKNGKILDMNKKFCQLVI